MQDLHKIYPRNQAQENALEELREYYFSIDDLLLKNHLIAKAIGFFFAALILTYNVMSFQKHLEANANIFALIVSTVALLLASIVAWVGGTYTARTLIDYFSKRNAEETAAIFREKLKKVAEQYVGETLPGDVIQMHINGQYIEGGFYGFSELNHPILTITILRHERIGDGYRDTGPLHLSFEDEKVQLWAGIVDKKKRKSRV